MPPACILLVEDEEQVRFLIQRILERAGLKVLVCPDGPSAVALFTQHAARIDLVLLDLCMPGLDGLETLGQLIDVRADIRAILMSGFLVEAPPLSPSLVGVLQKPFRPAELLARIDEALLRG